MKRAVLKSWTARQYATVSVAGPELAEIYRCLLSNAADKQSIETRAHSSKAVENLFGVYFYVCLISLKFGSQKRQN